MSVIVLLLQTVLAFILPPLAVLWKRGLWASFLLSIVLTIVGILPGVVYALYVVWFGGD